MQSICPTVSNKLLVMNKEVCSIKDFVVGLTEVAKDIEKTDLILLFMLYITVKPIITLHLKNFGIWILEIKTEKSCINLVKIFIAL